MFRLYLYIAFSNESFRHLFVPFLEKQVHLGLFVFSDSCLLLGFFFPFKI
jgi:hypothetical protein